MSKRRNITRWVISLATVFVLVLLAWQCVWIYWDGAASGRSPVFTAALVQARLRSVLPVLVGYAVLVLVSLISASLEEPKISRVSIAPEDRLHLLKARTAELPEEAKALERQRQRIRLSAGLAALICVIPGLLYLFQRENFLSWDLEQVMGQLLLHVVPWLVPAFALLLAASYACARSIRREIALLQNCAGQKKAEAPAPRPIPAGILRAGLYAIAILWIVLGVRNGGMRDVLVKAIHICTECIGLG